jgi:hypothetical protein
VSYRCANETFDPPPAEIVIEHGDGLQLLNAGPHLVQAAADHFAVPLTTKRYAEDRYTYLRVASRAHQREVIPAVTGPNLTLLCALRDAPLFLVIVCLLIASFAFTSLVVSIKPSDLGQASTTLEIGRALLTQVTWWRLAAAIAQAVLLYVLFRLIGKKPV